MCMFCDPMGMYFGLRFSTFRELKKLKSGDLLQNLLNVISYIHIRDEKLKGSHALMVQLSSKVTFTSSPHF